MAFKLPTCNSTHTNLLLYSSHLRRADVSRNGDGQVIDYFLLNSSNQITRQRCRFPVGCCNARECPDHCASSSQARADIFQSPSLSHKLNCIHAARVEAFPLQHARFAVREEPLRYAEHCFRVRARFRFLFCFVSFKARKMTAAVLVRYIVMRFPEPLARIEIKDAAK